MLDKLKVTMIVGIAIQVLRNFFPSLEVPEEFQTYVETAINSLYIIIPVVAGWFTKERAANVSSLTLR